MIAIGILLVLAAVGAAAMVATGGDTPTQVTFGAFHLQNSTGFFFFAGALCSAVLLIGAWTIWRGYVRWRARGRELEELRARASESPAIATAPDPDGASDPIRGYDTDREWDTLPVRSARTEPDDTADPFVDRPLRRSQRHRAASDSVDAPSSEAGVPT